MKTKLYILTALCAMVLAGCQKENIVFPIEIPQFEPQEGKILIEVIAPSETAIAKDKIYIQGAFSSNKPLELSRAEFMDYKYGIYLDPATFAVGKSLADGYWFSSALSGKEVIEKDTPIEHFETAEVGGRIDISLVHWEMFFNAHNGYVLYVDNKSTWKDLALYAWSSDGPEIFGGWPGMAPTGTEEIDGVEYTYFDLMSENTGKVYNFILNDNKKEEKQQDVISDFAITRDLYVELTDEGCKEKVSGVGYRIYALNHTGWKNMYLYVWGDGTFLGGWPGSKPLPEKVEVAGHKYDVFEFPANAKGKNMNLMFNSGNDEKTTPESTNIKLDKDTYVQVVIEGGPKVIDPEGEIVVPDLPVGPDEPKGDMTIHATKPAEWPNLYIYSSDNTNDWPGTLMVQEEDSEYYSFVLPAGAAFTFASAPIGNQSVEISEVVKDTWFILNNDGTYQVEEHTEE